MCRIAGFVDANSTRAYEIGRVVTAMRDTMRAGGPDGEGAWYSAEDGVALGHRRLSIIDLSAGGSQPMTFAHLTLTYNGEVYNYADIRAELELAGYSFTSTSDTEVVLKAFHKWGKKCVHKFRGMWAFAIWDAQKKALILCRDRMGVKPLFWYFENNVFVFASELKGIMEHPCFTRRLCYTGLSLYLQYGYIPGPYSIFKKTEKLEPGTWLEYDGKTVQKEPWWQVRDLFGIANVQETIEGNDEQGWLKQLEEVTLEACRLRMVADVPVGMFLSGGVDSSLVTALLQKESTQRLKTFTIGFNNPAFNEAPFAAEVSKILGTDHTEILCTATDALDVIKKYPDIYDEPFADPSGIPVYLVSKLAREQVKVVLSADGSDEQLGGYAAYSRVLEGIGPRRGSLLYPLFNAILSLFREEGSVRLAGMVRRIPFFAPHVDRIQKLAGFANEKSPVVQYDLLEKHLGFRRVAGLMKKELNRTDKSTIRPPVFYGNLDPLSQMLVSDLLCFLPDDMLAKVDRASMAVSLENREPLLDHKLIEFTARMPLNLKIRNSERKYAFRRILAKYVPERIVNRPKVGFEVPIFEWCAGDLAPHMNDYLDGSRVAREMIFKPSALESVRRASVRGSRLAARQAWIVLMFQMWREKYNPVLG